ncbi:deoxyribodipyrimidine photo-lyase/cryptochrome family protein [Opitutales bacterium]|nr:deoxyribodipyrimidine photo-lyase/cryptochrome family protein [Opitutales bacterium]
MKTAVLWFRKCLRLDDNPSLVQACEDSNVDSILPIFILDPGIVGEGFEKYGKNRLRFLLENLEDLDQQLQAKVSNPLHIFHGSPSNAVVGLQNYLKDRMYSFHSEYCSEPHGRSISQSIQDTLSIDKDIPCHFHPASHTILDLEKTISVDGFKNPKSMKDIQKIFSSTFSIDQDGFFQIPEISPEPKVLKPPPSDFNFQSCAQLFKGDLHTCSSLRIKFSKLKFLDTTDENCYFKGGESIARERLKEKVSTRHDYVNTFKKPKTSSTNIPSNPREPSTTGLSPYITIGSLSVRRLWKEVEKANRTGPHSTPPESLHGQLLFREMFYLLSRSVENWDQDQNNSMCKEIKWGEHDDIKMTAWEDGKTGFPLIDALMRQLKSTGWMHHLGRHAVSCFLTRGQLWQHWKSGRDIFDHKLLDSDWALNNANWLWLSGVAPFSMPYFRLYNPCPDGKSSLNVDAETAGFIRHWVPELENFPVKYIYEPHLAPLGIQESAGCIIGKDYPLPIVNRKEVAKENLASFKTSLAQLSA